MRGGLTLRTPLGEAQTLEWKTQLDYQDLDHPLSFAVIDQTTYNWGTELRYASARAALRSHGNRLTVGVQYFGHRQVDVQLAEPHRRIAGRSRRARSTVRTTSAPTSRTSST